MATRRERVERLFPAGAVVEDAFLDGDPPLSALMAEEAEAIARAVPSRQREFAEGRRCARRALTQLGFPAMSLPPRADRTLPWPAGVVGSVTHTDAWCGVVVARNVVLVTVGLDAEPRKPLSDHLVSRICTPQEQANFSSYGLALAPQLVARLVFSAKEAFYKAQYPLTGLFLGFQVVEVDLTRAATTGAFSIRSTPALDRRVPIDGMEGRVLLEDDHVITTVWLPAP